MRSPLHIRKLEDLKERNGQEIQSLKLEIADLHRRIRKLSRISNNKVRTDFIQIKDHSYVSWDINSLTQKGAFRYPANLIYISSMGSGTVWVSSQAWDGASWSQPLIQEDSYQGKNLEEVVALARQELLRKGWIFVGAEYDADASRVRITDWRELA